MATFSRMSSSSCSTSYQLPPPKYSIHRTFRPNHRALRASAPGRKSLHVSAHIDYTATASDDGVLRLPPRLELLPDEIRNVYNYPRNIYSKYSVGDVIGAGSFGVVRECTELATGRKYAVKTVGKTPKRGPPTPRYLLKLRTEVEVMKQLGSSLNAVYLKDVYEDDKSVHLVMELCTGGALLDRVQNGYYSERYIAGLVRSILRFISQCHAKGIIYRDVKPDNFLFLSKAPDSPLKATDFGLAIRHWPHEPKLSSRSGTPAYMAPELVAQSYNQQADIWSVGMLSYQLLTGMFPFWEDVRQQTLADVWSAILNDPIDWDAPELMALTPPARDFLEKLLQRDPAIRFTAAQALEHPWLEEVEEGNDGDADAPLQGSVVQRLQRFATYSFLKQLVLKIIIDDMTAQSRSVAELPPMLTALRDLFNQLDADQSGSISFEELAQGLQAQGYVVDRAEVEQLMTKLDLDHDGNLVYNEFVATMLDWSQVAKTQGWQAQLERAFKRLDRNGDGFISLDEILNELPATAFAGSVDPEGQRVAEAKKMLREADANGDGKISRQEFTELLQSSVVPDSLSFYDDRLAAHSSGSSDTQDLLSAAR